MGLIEKCSIFELINYFFSISGDYKQKIPLQEKAVVVHNCLWLEGMVSNYLVRTTKNYRFLTSPQSLDLLIISLRLHNISLAKANTNRQWKTSAQEANCRIEQTYIQTNK